MPSVIIESKDDFIEYARNYKYHTYSLEQKVGKKYVLSEEARLEAHMMFNKSSFLYIDNYRTRYALLLSMIDMLLFDAYCYLNTNILYGSYSFNTSWEDMNREFLELFDINIIMALKNLNQNK